MKSIDANAIGRLIEEMLNREAAFPIADREHGYEEDNIQSLNFVGGNQSQLGIVTDKGQVFIVSVNQIEEG